MQVVDSHAINPRWYKKAFNRENYFDQYTNELGDKRTRHEVNFIVQQTGLEQNLQILDIACGHGRHVNELARRGFSHVTGVDIAPNALHKAQEAATLLSVNPTFVEGDVKRLPFERNKFERVYCVFTSFGYFPTEAEDHEMLREISRVLKPTGIFLLDVLSLESVTNRFRLEGYPEERKDWLVIPKHIQLLSGIKRETTQWFHPVSRILQTRREWIENGKPAYHESFIRLYSKKQLEIALSEVGLKILSVDGDYDGSRHNTNNDRTIIVSQK